MPAATIPAVGAIINDASGRLLLVKRGKPPQAGRWTLPGGKVEPGESDQQALVREVREETGLSVSAGPLAGTVRRPAPGGAVFDIRDYRATLIGGSLRAGDDAAGACWASPADLASLPLTTGLMDALTRWGVLAEPHPPAVQPPAGQPPAGQPPAGLIAEATRRAGVIWLGIGGSRPRPAWHVWRGAADIRSLPPGTAAQPEGAADGEPAPPGAAYVLTGPGEQPLPGLENVNEVTVDVPSKESGGLLVTWTARVSRVRAGSAEWNAVVGQLAAGRLNARPGSGQDAPAARWAHTGAVFRLDPLHA